jgi:hypothetical protein
LKPLQLVVVVEVRIVVVVVVVIQLKMELGERSTQIRGILKKGTLRMNLQGPRAYRPLGYRWVHCVSG